MICAKCGADNPDQAMSCHVCGHKLQSTRDTRQPDEHAPEPERMPLLDAAPGRKDLRLRPYREAWLVGLAMVGMVFLLLGEHLSWPLYPVIALAAAYAWLRGLH